MQKQLLKVQVSNAAIFSCKATTINLENCKIHRHWNEYSFTSKSKSQGH